THEAKQTADALISRAANDDALRLTAHRLIAAMEHMQRLEGQIEQETRSRVDFRAALHELSRITPPTIRFTNVSFGTSRWGRRRFTLWPRRSMLRQLQERPNPRRWMNRRRSR